jgi:hypothetical protein
LDGSGSLNGSGSGNGSGNGRGTGSGSGNGSGNGRGSGRGSGRRSRAGARPQGNPAFDGSQSVESGESPWAIRRGSGSAHSSAAAGTHSPFTPLAERSTPRGWHPPRLLEPLGNKYGSPRDLPQLEHVSIAPARPLRAAGRSHAQPSITIKTGMPPLAVLGLRPARGRLPQIARFRSLRGRHVFYLPRSPSVWAGMRTLASAALASGSLARWRVPPSGLMLPQCRPVSVIERHAQVRIGVLRRDLHILRPACMLNPARPERSEPPADPHRPRRGRAWRPARSAIPHHDAKTRARRPVTRRAERSVPRVRRPPRRA